MVCILEAPSILWMWRTKLILHAINAYCCLAMFWYSMHSVSNVVYKTFNFKTEQVCSVISCFAARLINTIKASILKMFKKHQCICSIANACMRCAQHRTGTSNKTLPTFHENTANIIFSIHWSRFALMNRFNWFLQLRHLVEIGKIDTCQLSKVILNYKGSAVKII